jgi:purine-nucleoside phosphorylase
MPIGKKEPTSRDNLFPAVGARISGMSPLPTESLKKVLASQPPQFAIILGSGLGLLAQRLQLLHTWSYADLAGLTSPGVPGHAGQLHYGLWAGVPVLLFCGRLHYYEGHTWEETTAPVRLASALGVKQLLLTNAAGGIRSDLQPGSLMLLFHHLRWTQPYFWRRGVQKSDPIWYSDRLNQVFKDAAAEMHVPLTHGIYCQMTGPSYETPAEIRALRSIGVDAVGMSTACEAEQAYALGLECVGISCITNIAAGLSTMPPNHEEVIRESRNATDRLGNLMERFLMKLP